MTPERRKEILSNNLRLNSSFTCDICHRNLDAIYRGVNGLPFEGKRGRLGICKVCGEIIGADYETDMMSTPEVAEHWQDRINLAKSFFEEGMNIVKEDVESKLNWREKSKETK